MIENILIKKNFTIKTKITIKSIISTGLIILAITLPQLVHLTIGAQGGVLLLPMYLPILIGGCLLGTSWGIGIGILSPLMSFLLTSLIGNPMPTMARMPLMMGELIIFALISGMFSKKISQNVIFVFPAIILSQLGGRLFLLATAFLFQNLSSISTIVILEQIQTGTIGLLAQLIIVPSLVIILNKLLNKEKPNV